MQSSSPRRNKGPGVAGWLGPVFSQLLTPAGPLCGPDRTLPTSISGADGQAVTVSSHWKKSGQKQNLKGKTVKQCIFS